MAKNRCSVFLGFLDEAVSTKYQSSTDHTTNKLGGNPDFPVSGIAVPNCPICGLKRPLLLQIYAPLDNSVFHRTLFLFGCLNPACSTQSKGWLCIRSQVMEKPKECDGRDNQKRGRQEDNAMQINWCSGADDWSVDEDDQNHVDIPPTTCLDNDQFLNPKKNLNDNEENGNSIVNDNYRLSDEDDESTSSITAGDQLSIELNLMQIDEDNANCNGAGAAAAGMDGAVGPMCPGQRSSQASAEIEGEEKDNVVTIDTPMSPHRDLIALLKQTSALRTDSTNSLTLSSYFLFVEEEVAESNARVSEHVRELLHEYQKKDEKVNKTPDSPTGKDLGSGGGGGGVADTESYEKAAPAHGDLLFHAFLMRIQDNPGQILRYSRNSGPLLIAPLTEKLDKCAYCNAELICELQLLPTLIPSLTLDCNGEGVPIEFGTVLVYTCAKSCWDTPDKSRQEICVVQREL